MFAFTPLRPSEYTLTVESPGFTKLAQKDIRLFAADKVSLPDLALAVGSVNETVSVEASAVNLQTKSSERSRSRHPHR
ncbi:MAG: carboxypeptidase-like regulatory domain-containing protein [Acidobacteriota bacterium]|nr:carboxypeptidase-like regulatory domain-containing protein [Acidobacteriota bacterium]